MSRDSKTKCQVRRLTIEDTVAVEQIYRATQTWMGAPVPADYLEHNLAIVKKEYLSKQSKNRILFGAFHNGELALTVGIFFWTHLPFCTVLRMVGRTDAVVGKALLRCIDQLWDAVFDAIEGRDCTRFYILSTAQHFNVLARAGRFKQRLVANYMMTIEETIPPHTKPRFDYIWPMMGRRTWPAPLVVRAGTLRSHMRTPDSAVLDDEMAKIFDESNPK